MGIDLSIETWESSIEMFSLQMIFHLNDWCDWIRSSSVKMIISFKSILIEWDLFMLFGGVSNNSHYQKDNNIDQILLHHKNNK